MSRGSRPRASSEDALNESTKEGSSEAEEAIRKGLERAVNDADAAGALPSFLVGPVRKAVESVPPWLLLDTLEQLGNFLP